MHPQSPLLTIGGTVLEESDDFVILGVTFDSKMTFEKHLRSVSRAASQRLGILRNSWRVFHDRSLLQKQYSKTILQNWQDKTAKASPFAVLSCQFWSIVLQSGARLPIHTLNYWTEQSVVPGF